jgi:RHS repeat-associated protein
VVLYCGYRWDGETGLYHVRHRMYHATLGRWIQRDPAGYQDGPSLYEYGGSKPLETRDPEGLKVWTHEIISPDAAVRRTARGEAAGHALRKGYAVAQSPFGIAGKIGALVTLRSQNYYPFLYLGYKTYSVFGNNRFVYTCQYGWLDLGHFFQSAFAAYATGSPKAAFEAGRFVEKGQDLMRRELGPSNEHVETWKDSAWTAEDLPSDDRGAKFGGAVHRKDAALRNSASWWKLVPPSASITDAFKARLKQWGAVSHEKPEVLCILKKDAESWIDASGKVLPAARHKTVRSSMNFQSKGIAHKCLCEGSTPKEEYTW